MFLAAAAVLFAAAAVVRFGVAPRVLERLQPGDEWLAEFAGFTSVPDEKTGTFPQPHSSRYTRRFTVTAAPGRPDSVHVEDVFTDIDLATGQVTYQHVFRDTVERRTGRHTDPSHAGQVYVLPRFTEKAEYRLRASYLEGIPIRFEAEETVAGLDTYIFSYRGPGENIGSYSGTPEYPGISVTPEQVIRCADDQLVYRAWVEPVTGDTLKVQESCRSGDYVYERASGRPVKPIMAWGGETSGGDVVRRAETIRADRTRILLATRYVPGGLLLAALVLCAAGWRSRRRAVK